MGVFCVYALSEFASCHRRSMGWLEWLLKRGLKPKDEEEEIRQAWYNPHQAAPFRHWVSCLSVLGPQNGFLYL